MIKRNYWYQVIRLDVWPNTNKTKFVHRGIFSIRSWKRKSNEEVYESIRDEAIRLVRHKVDSGMSCTPVSTHIQISVHSPSYSGRVLASEIFPIDWYSDNTNMIPFHTEVWG